ncbi:hypothetical protein K505DRAFT_265561 [Melanomma pulvis-pyrius CBS 109.77]|uniref:Uncharacterized protein n=1 Tax=Melanomma pulvis-pyrius CBS 109.77 TaxID=1314802 RepID=A0A6A6XSU9_9PLEO|nr:hypothetical protein K505DRAFT_265561 [Melanomma pulvis-pyrius CBS 109.77]
MPTHSSEFLSPTSPFNPPLHRSRSGGYTDFLAEKEKWERRDREKEMKKYHDSHYSNSSPSPSSHQRHSASDRLYVPTFDNSHRRVRSYDQIVERKSEDEEHLTRGYRVREERPRSYDDAGVSVTASASTSRTAELPVRPKRTGTGKQRRPSIKVQIHQDDAPRPAAAVTPRKSPNASPRSPSAQPQLLFLSSTLQTRLAEIRTICQPNLHIEAADPRDLTFSKIAEEVQGFAFQFKIWSHVVNLKNMERIDVSKRKNVELAARTLDRILGRIDELLDVCAKASPRELKIEPLPEYEGEDEYASYEDDDSENEHDGSVKDVTETLGFIIQSHLDSIRFQMQTLSRLTRSLQEATPDAKAEVVAVGNLVADVDRFISSPDAVDRYSIHPKRSGSEALNEARYIAGRSR